MSKAYDEYLKNHIEAVHTAARWIFKHCGEDNVKEILPGVKNGKMTTGAHDTSKYSKEEYQAYDDYFYGPDGIKRNEGPSEKVERNFQYAWLHHIHNNPHHWQHWILKNDDPDEGQVALEMPDCFILEMIADWWSFSWRKGNLWELWNWWSDHSDYIKLGPETRKKVIKMLDIMNQALIEDDTAWDEWKKKLEETWDCVQ